MIFSDFEIWKSTIFADSAKVKILFQKSFSCACGSVPAVPCFWKISLIRSKFLPIAAHLLLGLGYQNQSESSILFHCTSSTFRWTGDSHFRSPIYFRVYATCSPRKMPFSDLDSRGATLADKKAGIYNAWGTTVFRGTADFRGVDDLVSLKSAVSKFSKIACPRTKFCQLW